MRGEFAAAIILVCLGSASPLATSLEVEIGVLWSSHDPKSSPFARIDGQGEATAIQWTRGNSRVDQMDFHGKALQWQAETAQKNTDGDLDVSSETGRIIAFYANVFAGGLAHLRAWDSSSASPIWTRQIGVATVAPREQILTITDDGNLVAYAYQDAMNLSKYLYLLDGDTGQTVWSTTLPGAPLHPVEGVEISNDGKVVLVGLGDRVLVYASSGVLLAEHLHAFCCGVPALSADGQRFAAWRTPGQVVMFTFDGTTYAQTWHASIPHTVATVALSPDGQTVLAYAYHTADGGCRGNRLYVFHPPATAPFSSYANYGDNACLVDVDFSADGTRAVLGTWGTMENQVQPQDALRDVFTVLDLRTPVAPVPLFRLLDDIHWQGSATMVSMSDDGKHVVLSAQEGHAMTLSFAGGRVWAVHLP